MPSPFLSSEREAQERARIDCEMDFSELLDLATEVARERSQRVWVVGGAVRDLLDHRSSTDLDLVTLGDSTAYSEALALRLGVSCRIESRFLTTAFTSSSGFLTDVVRARCESYPRPGALPDVRPGTLLEDLFRRDFTVNSMAFDLTDPARTVIDPFGGMEDLGARRLRVLHERSFFDDPTRILRGVRLAARFGMKFEARTERQASAAIAAGMLDLLSGDRLRRELELLFDDPGALIRAQDDMTTLGLDEVLLSAPICRATGEERLERLVRAEGTLASDGSRWMAALLALTWDLSAEERRNLMDRLEMSRPHRRTFASLPLQASRLGRALETLDSLHETFRIGEALGEFGRAVVAACGNERVRAFLGDEWRRLESRRPRIGGSDLVALGFDSGPAIGAALEATFRARLEGAIASGEELGFAVRYLRGRHEPRASAQRAGARGSDERSSRGRDR